MRRLGIGACAATLLLGLALQAAAQDDMVQKRDDKLAEKWIKSAKWILDYDKARDTAKKSGKMIFAYFTRSYAF